MGGSDDRRRINYRKNAGRFGEDEVDERDDAILHHRHRYHHQQRPQRQRQQQDVGGPPRLSSVITVTTVDSSFDDDESNDPRSTTKHQVLVAPCFDHRGGGEHGRSSQEKEVDDNDNDNDEIPWDVTTLRDATVVASSSSSSRLTVVERWVIRDEWDRDTSALSVTTKNNCPSFGEEESSSSSFVEPVHHHHHDETRLSPREWKNFIHDDEGSGSTPSTLWKPCTTATDEETVRRGTRTLVMMMVDENAASQRQSLSSSSSCQKYDPLRINGSCKTPSSSSSSSSSHPQWWTHYSRTTTESTIMLDENRNGSTTGGQHCNKESTARGQGNNVKGPVDSGRDSCVSSLWATLSVSVDDDGDEGASLGEGEDGWSSGCDDSDYEFSSDDHDDEQHTGTPAIVLDAKTPMEFPTRTQRDPAEPSESWNNGMEDEDEEYDECHEKSLEALMTLAPPTTRRGLAPPPEQDSGTRRKGLRSLPLLRHVRNSVSGIRGRRAPKG